MSDFPPASLFVRDVLEHSDTGALSFGELHDATTLPKSTLSDALERLTDAGSVEKRITATGTSVETTYVLANT